MSFSKIAFGGGCFWCTEAVFVSLKGIKEVTPGYAGGSTPNPTYESVSMGKTGYAEVILLEYDPQKISTEKLLEVFFTGHDPTTLNRQGNDVGTQYRSVIFYSEPQQKEVAEKMLNILAKKYSDPIVTEISPLNNFYPAEEYHQRYYEKHPQVPYAEYIISPKVEKIKEKYPELLK